MKNLTVLSMLMFMSLTIKAASLSGGGGGGLSNIDNHVNDNDQDYLNGYITESENLIISLDIENFDEVSEALDSKILEIKSIDEKVKLRKKRETSNQIILEDKYGNLGRIDRVESVSEETTGKLAIDEAKVTIEIMDSLIITGEN